MGKQSGIYKITCLKNNKIYVGSSVDYRDRIRSHFNSLKKGNHKNAHLQSAFSLYGINSFVHELLEIVIDKQKLLEREQYWLDYTQCYNREIGFNICITAGSNLGRKITEQAKINIKNAILNRSEEVKKNHIIAIKKANTGKCPPNKGIKMWENKPHPRGGLGKKYLNRKFTPEGYIKICEVNRRPKAEGFKEKRSLASSKSYYFIEPDTGCELKIENLKKYCIENGLNPTRMYEVAKGKLDYHRGWRREEACYMPPPADADLLYALFT